MEFAISVCVRALRVSPSLLPGRVRALRVSPPLLPGHRKVLSVAPIVSYRVWIAGRESTYEARDVGFVLGTAYLAGVRHGPLWLCCGTHRGRRLGRLFL